MSHQNHKTIFGCFAATSFSLAVLAIAPIFCAADIIVNEIMYNLEGSDTNRKWLEIKNTGPADVDITGWKFADLASDGTISKHNLYIPPDHGGVGTMVLSAGSFAILADNAETFLGEHPNFFGAVIDTTISNFGQQDNRTYGAKMIDKDGAEVNSMSYTILMGASGDGNSLQLSGGNWIAAAPTPGAANASLSSSTPPSGDQSNSASSTTTTAPTTYSSSANRVPVEPQIFAHITGDRSSVVGVESIFKGTTFGLDKKPIEGARYLWSFGDGTIKEGQAVAHAWRMTGTYLVVLEVSSGEFNAANRQKVSVSAANVFISKAEGGKTGSVAVKNGQEDDVNLSRWGLRSRGKTFNFPSPTIILAGTAVYFANDITGLDPDPEAVELLYPNGLVASQFTPEAPKPVTVAPVSVATKPISKPVVQNNSSKLASIPAIKKSVAPAEKPLTPTFSEFVASTTIIYSGTAAAAGSGVSLDWILALIGVVGIGGLGVLFSTKPKFGEVNLSRNMGDNEGAKDGEQSLRAEDFEVMEEKDE